MPRLKLTLTFVVLVLIGLAVGTGLVSLEIMLATLVLGGAAVALPLILAGWDFEDEGDEGYDRLSMQYMFEQVNQKLRDRADGEPLDFDGGEQVRMESKEFKNNADEWVNHTAVFAKTKGKRRPLLVIFCHEENRIRKLKYDPEELREHPFRDYNPYGKRVGREGYRRRDEEDRNGRRGRRGDGGVGRSTTSGDELDRISGDLSDNV